MPLPCPRPAPPDLPPLDPEEYLAGPVNLKKLMRNISALRAYAEGLEYTVNCYEKQNRSIEDQGGSHA